MDLVTGATGIIGSHVTLQLLKEGRTVIAGKRKESDTSKTRALFNYYNASEYFERIRWVDIDIQDIFSIEEALAGITNVFHCAGFVSFNKSDRKKLFEINTNGTKNVVNACLALKTESLCHVSTIGAINNLDHPSPLNEKVFWKTSGRESDYGLSKYGAEREVWRGMEEGLNAVIVNPGVVIGPGFWDQSSARIFNNCYKGNKFYTPGLTGYVAATDVALIMIELVRQRLFSNRYILVEDNYHFKTIFDQVHKHFNKPAPSIKATRTLLNFASVMERFASLFTGKDPLLSRGLINAAFNTQEFSNDKVKKALNFNFQPVKITIEEVCKIYISEHEKVASSH